MTDQQKAKINDLITQGYTKETITEASGMVYLVSPLNEKIVVFPDGSVKQVLNG